MAVLKLMGKQFLGLRFSWVSFGMFLFLTFRTFISSNGIFLAGICMAFLPYFTQTKHIPVFGENVSERQYLFSRYMMYLLVVQLGLVYLQVISYLGSLYSPWYISNPYAGELILLAYICNLAFISLLVPLTLSLKGRTLLMTAVIFFNVEMFFMYLMNKVLPILQANGFIFSEQWGIYALTILLPLLAVSALLISTQKPPLATKCLE